MIFRRITKLDASSLAPLLEDSLAEGFRFVARFAEEWASGELRFDRPGEVLLGAFENGQLVAIGGLTPDSDTAEPNVGRLRRLYVRPRARRRGVGRRLVLALEAVAQGTYRSVVLRTDTEAAARFYERLGYMLLSPAGSATHRRELDERAV